MNKRFALIPEEREKECTHEWMHFRGSMPCTGPKVCSMCGLTDDDILAERVQAHQELPLPTGKIGFPRPLASPIMYEDEEHNPDTDIGE